MANFSFYLSSVFLLLGSGFPRGLDAATYYLAAKDYRQDFTSLHYPFNYLHYTNDYWVMDSGSSLYSIHIDVVDSSLEASNNLCYDYFQFRDGYTSGASSGRYCGSWSNCYFESSGRYATISMITNGSHAYRGFKMSFYRVLGTWSSALTTCTTGSTSIHSTLLSRLLYRSHAAPSVSLDRRISSTIVAIVLFGRVNW